MTTGENKLEQVKRKARERKAIIEELEKFKTDKGDSRRLILLIADEKETSMLPYNIDAREAVWALAIAQSTAVEQINQTWRQSQGMDSK